jgi:hypothetical protein
MSQPLCPSPRNTTQASPRRASLVWNQGGLLCSAPAPAAPPWPPSRNHHQHHHHRQQHNCHRCSSSGQPPAVGGDPFAAALVECTRERTAMVGRGGSRVVLAVGGGPSRPLVDMYGCNNAGRRRGGHVRGLAADCVGDPPRHRRSPCSLGLSATSQQYFSLKTKQPPTTSQQYSSLRTNQHQPSATSQPNSLGDEQVGHTVGSHHG